MKIVIDTNIFISSLFKNGKKFREIIWNPDNEIFAPNFLVVEIFKHKDKIVKYSGMVEEDLLNELYLLLKSINFINEN
nr:nucleotide-binding protein, PIN domain-containing protein [Candidatus Gracilibacteria bacterium]